MSLRWCSADGLESGRDAKRLAREFTACDVKPCNVQPGGAQPAVSWRFVPRDAKFNYLFLRRPIQREFTALRLWVRNVGAALTLAVKVGEAGGAEWTAARVPLAAGGDWQWVEFPRSAWHVASWSHDASGRLDFPLAYLALIAYDIKAGGAYELQTSRVEVVHPDPPGSRSTISSSPASSTPAGAYG